MRPFIRGGRDSVVLRHSGQIAVGDIVLAHTRERGYVLHRVYRMLPDTLVLMGDGNLREEENCRRGDVIGKVTGIIRKGRCIDCTSRGERWKAGIWMRLLPVRRLLLICGRL